MSISLSLVVEDVLSEAILRKIIEQPNISFVVGPVINGRGFGYIKSRIKNFNVAAKTQPYLILTDLDLDKGECPPVLIKDWLGEEKIQPNLIFRVAVREVEAWLLADRETFASFLGVSKDNIPLNVESIDDPKNFLINLVDKKSKKRSLCKDIVPKLGSTAKIGPGYNNILCNFVNEFWNANRASLNSPSLQRAIKAITQFKPVKT